MSSVAGWREAGQLTVTAWGWYELAWIRQARGDPAGARDAIDSAVQAAPGPGGLLNPVPAQRAWLLLAQGDLPKPRNGRRRAVWGWR